MRPLVRNLWSSWVVPRRPALISTSAMIGSAACWGSATVFSRDLLFNFTSSALLVVQLTASVGVLLVIAYLESRSGRARLKGLFRASLTGTLEPGLAYSIGLLGLSLTSASNAAVISATEPVLIVLIAWIFLSHRPDARLSFSIAVAVAGVLLVSWVDIASASEGSLLGDLLIVLATAFAAAYVVLSSRLARDYPPGTLAAGQQSVGLVFAVLAYALVEGLGWQHQQWDEISAPLMLYAAFSGVVQYAAAFMLYLIGLRYLAPGVAALWLTLVPVFGVLFAMLWLGESPAASTFAGGFLIISAIMISGSKSKPRIADEQPQLNP